MTLNNGLRPKQPRDPRVFPTTQLALLAFVRVAEPIALTSIFPYAFQLVRHFNIGDKNNASFYAGLLIAAFALAESLTGLFWGGLSDKVGRKPILLLGCSGTVISLLIVGFSTSFWMALAGRALGGLLNGNIGVIQTMVGELVTLKEHEPKAYSIMPFVWSIGTIIGPAIGGYFCKPSENFPTVFPADGIFAKFPFLLPNVICASILCFAIAAGVTAIEETHPDMQAWSTPADRATSTAETPLMATSGTTANAPADLSNESTYGTFNAVETETEDKWRVRPNGRPSSVSSLSKSKVFSRRIIMLVVALGIFTYHSMTFDTLLPIFLGDEVAGDSKTSSASHPFAGGLGLTLQQIGIILSFNGIIALVIQGVVFPFMAHYLGIWRLFMLVTIGHPLAYILIPFLDLLPPNLVYPGIYICLAVRNFFSILAYPVILILLKEASPGPNYLGKINGLAASTGAACRTIASPIGGYLYGVGVQFDFTPLAWWASALVAVVGAVQVFFMRGYKNTSTVHTLARHMSRESLRDGGVQRETVHITVDTIYEDSEEGGSSGNVSASASVRGDEEAALLSDVVDVGRVPRLATDEYDDEEEV